MISLFVFDTAYRLRIPPDTFDAPLLFFYFSHALEAAVACPAGGAATHFDLRFVPPCGRQRRIQFTVIPGKDDRPIVMQQCFDQRLVVAVAQLVFVAAGLAHTGHIRRIAIGEPAGAGEPRQAVAPVAALDLHLLQPVVDKRQIVEARPPAVGRRRGDAGAPGAAEHAAERLAGHKIPACRLLDRIVDRGPGAEALLVKFAGIRHLTHSRHERPEIFAGRDHTEEAHNAAVDVIIDFDLRRGFGDQDRSAAAERLYITAVRRQGCEQRAFDPGIAFPTEPGKRGTDFACIHIVLVLFPEF